MLHAGVTIICSAGINKRKKVRRQRSEADAEAEAEAARPAYVVDEKQVDKRDAALYALNAEKR